MLEEILSAETSHLILFAIDGRKWSLCKYHYQIDQYRNKKLWRFLLKIESSFLKLDDLAEIVQEVSETFNTPLEVKEVITYIATILYVINWLSTGTPLIFGK